MNIVLLIADQMRWDAIGLQRPNVRTPNLNKLGREGIYCTRTYTQSPQCQPARASLFTGRYPTAHKFWWNGLSLPKSERTIGNILTDAGYTCAYFGKGHISLENEAQAMEDFGFTGPKYLLRNWMQENPQRFAMLKKFMQNECWTGKYPNITGDVEACISQAAIKWLKEPGDRKFTVISYYGPHPPYAAPPPFNSMYPNAAKPQAAGTLAPSGYVMKSKDWKALISQYYGSVSWIDRNIEEVLKHVGPDDLVIFTSDHGDILGDHKQFSKGLYAYEGNVRVPLMFKHPSLGSKDYEHIVEHVDIIPTILDIVGIEKPAGLQGRSLLRGFKFDQKTREAALSMIGHDGRVRAVTTDRHKYWIHGNQEFLFNLVQDPGELNNLASGEDRIRLLSKMRKHLIQALIRAEDPLPIPLDNM